MGKKKDIADCKHPNSRKTKALTKHMKKVSNRQKAKFGTALKQNMLAEKVLWFKEHMDENVACCTATQVEQLIEIYLSRFNEELEQIKIKHSIGNRKNRQHASREDVITLTVKSEREEFETAGIEMPDLLSPKHVEILKKWNGELRFLQNISLKRFSKKFLTKKREEENTSMKMEDDIPSVTKVGENSSLVTENGKLCSMDAE